MRYIATLIADTPDYPKGTKLLVQLRRNGNTYNVYRDIEECGAYELVDSVDAKEFDNKTHWLSDGKLANLQIDENCYNQIKCPICGETKLRIWHNKPYKKYSWWDDCNYKIIPIMITCRNGHRSKLSDVMI